VKLANIKVRHEYSTLDHQPKYTCWCKPRILSGILQAWKNIHYYEEIIVLHREV